MSGLFFKLGHRRQETLRFLLRQNETIPLTLCPKQAYYTLDRVAIKAPEVAESSSSPTTLSLFLISTHFFKLFMLEGKSSEVMAVKGQSLR